MTQNRRITPRIAVHADQVPSPPGAPGQATVLDGRTSQLRHSIEVALQGKAPPVPQKVKSGKMSVGQLLGLGQNPWQMVDREPGNLEENLQRWQDLQRLCQTMVPAYALLVAAQAEVALGVAWRAGPARTQEDACPHMTS